MSRGRLRQDRTTLGLTSTGDAQLIGCSLSGEVERACGVSSLSTTAHDQAYACFFLQVSRLEANSARIDSLIKLRR